MTWILLASGLLAGTLLLPHAFRSYALEPRVGVVLWISVLSLRAALALATAVIALLYLPGTELFGLLTHWCFHAVLPFFAEHLGFDGHHLGDAAVLVPSIVVGILLVSGCFGIYRAARRVRTLLGGEAIGVGPRQSTIVPGSEIVVAAAGVRRPKVVVSAGALIGLDEDELAAGLEHEWGHINQGHGRILVMAEICLAMSRFIPGGRKALRELRFQLEREADEYAVRQTGDALALAAAITKAAATAPQRDAAPTLSLLGGTRRAADRVRLLIGEEARPLRRSAAGRLVALAAAALALAVAASVPVLVLEAPSSHGSWHSAHDCPA